MAELRIDSQDIGATRDRVSQWLEQRAHPLSTARHSDVLIAASELLSNADEHARAPGTTVVIAERPDGEIRLRVINAARPGAIAHPSHWQMPSEPLAHSGRGLAIVAHVSDCAIVQYGLGHVAVTAIFDAEGARRDECDRSEGR